jgi:hypothetical protein
MGMLFFEVPITYSMRSEGLLSADQQQALMLEANNLINMNEPDWFEKFSKVARNLAGCSKSTWQQLIDETIAHSDIIRYVHLGNPESIIISSQAVVDALQDA